MTVKLRGKKKWNHKDDLYTELMACEIRLDRLQQEVLRDLKDYVFVGNDCLPYKIYQKRLNEISRALGYIRSAQAILGHSQKTLKRWTKPAPNQLKEFPKNRQPAKQHERGITENEPYKIGIPKT